MIIVELHGRLGNQMFQYALARSLKESGKEVYVDSRMLGYDGNDNELGIFPALSVREAGEAEVSRLGDCNKTFLNKLRRKTIGYKGTHKREMGYQYHPEVFGWDEVYLDGYWQSEKYFCQIAEDIRKDFCFPAFTEPANQKIYGEMQGKTAISLHIRRGDYLAPKIAAIHGNICTQEYYDRAVRYFRERYPDACFFVFTDDAAWAREHYKDTEHFRIIDNNRGDQSFRDMQLMSCCDHHIIANSSFSWWGAWLNDKPDKEVIAPSKWFNTAETPDVWREGWMKL